MSNKYNNSKHDAETADQKPASHEVGEHRNGRKSPIKNSSPTDKGPETEYLSEIENTRYE